MRLFGVLACLLMLAGCGESWNNPYPAALSGKNILYSSFADRPKHLDPAQSYTADEYDFIWQVYEPPLQYHYLKRPYTLIPATAADIPRPRYFSRSGAELPASAREIAYSVYEIHIKPGIRYQPHPAFAKDAAGRSLYLNLEPADLRGKYKLADFSHSGSRELVAADYVHQIKRLAHPRIHSPILGHMSDYIVGLKEFAALLEHEEKLPQDAPSARTILDRHEIAGVEVVDRYTYRIKVRGKYPQFIYWLAMPFFAPVPPEADRFYAQPGMAERNFSLDWYPVGTGPYMLTENNPNARMVLARNPNFRGEAYPAEGEPEDSAAGLLADAGKMAPFIDTILFTREKESIPYWSKFMQGYYDQSGISNDNFDNAVRVNIEGEAALSQEMESRGIRLKTSVATSVYYLSFNWLDPVVGGQGDAAARERARKLRQAISIAIDNEEFISIFANGRGVPGQGPIPPGIFGFRQGDESFNPVVYEKTRGAWQRKPIAQAKRLIAEAGYPNGRDVNTGAPLVLYLDTTGGGPGGKARLDWYRKQFQKIDVQLEFRTSDWNRFQEKIRKGNTQLFFLGWNADYPDPE
ncbi:MAG: ABC transporter substrate-binding protein, partial [Pseudomonadota bacterium]